MYTHDFIQQSRQNYRNRILSITRDHTFVQSINQFLLEIENVTNIYILNAYDAEWLPDTVETDYSNDHTKYRRSFFLSVVFFFMG